LKRICIFGESFDKVKEFVNYIFELGNEEVNEENIIIYENNNGYWNVSKEKKPRKIESVIFKPEFIKSVLEDIEDFILSEEWYTEMGIPYKRSYLLYGPPGTGKSSFAQAIAAEIKYSICFVNCSDKINDFNFNRLLNSSPKKSIILIEDVDAIFTERKNTEKMNALTFSGFLNAIDGVRSQEGRIIIMTTNYKEKLDPALLRPGRVDELYEINYASKYQIEKMCLRFYKDEQLAKSFAEKLPIK
jgi:chaperone BCS1